VVEAVEECKRMKIFVLPPDINNSDTKFTIEENIKSLDSRAIRFGLSAIKNVGEAAIAAIFSARSSGEFTSFTDFCFRVDSQKVNRKVLESLIKSGSLDTFGRRSAMLSALDKIRELGTSISRLKSSGQESLFGDSEKSNTEDHLPDMQEFEKTKKLEMEKELLGFYLTEHPHAEKLSQIGNVVSHRISQLYADDYSNQVVSIGGIIESCRQVMTKNGNLPMCFAKISDLGKSIEATVFPRVYAVTSDVWRPDNLVVLSGKVEPLAFSPEEESDGLKKTITMVVNSAAIFTGPDTRLPQISSSPNVVNRQNEIHHPRVISIYIPKNSPSSKLVSLNSLLQHHKGDTQAQLVFAANGSTRSVPLPYGLDWNNDLKQEIDSLLNN
jgi:DNA polymerase-3 subunit alpha